ncbi:30S ribosomal protein S12 methylthiotransferase RimO [Lentisphaerota bacterium ZTH]|nr:30S ribosomal protein S12 methylthiotransferase RimO [Lentisphaerota bacterium]WET05794.1 30S ribosomal protein S12 methylthiotransferase RimO [Lentisphaerota bacterium ZTH]
MTAKRKKITPGLVFIASLGCPKNLVDTEVMAGVLVSEGWGLTFNPDDADVFLVNTCAFIPPAREEASEVLAQAVSWKKQEPRRRKVVVTGCLVQWEHLERFHNEFPDVDLWAGIDEIPSIGKIMKQLVNGRIADRRIMCSCDPMFIYDDEMPRLKLTLPHVAYMKVCDGCDNRCSYCSIPNIRGGLRSRPIDSIVREAHNLLEGGSRELLIMAQDTTAFGMDNDRGESFAKLLCELDRIDGDHWLRVLYTHPAHFNDQVIEVFNNSKHLLPYIDIPLQHISENILSRMGRLISGADTRALMKKIRREIPEMAVRTTFITGFPGETEDNFKELKDFAAEQQFERLGVFAFFPEPGTPAADFENQVPHEVAEQRAAEIMEQQAKISLNCNEKLVGTSFDVIIDFIENDNAVGRTYMDAPEIDNVVVLPGAVDLQPGDFCKAEITAATEYDLTAKVVD